MSLGFFPSHSLGSPTLACAGLIEVPWGWVGQLKRKAPLERGLRETHPGRRWGGSSHICILRG